MSTTRVAIRARRRDFMKIPACPGPNPADHGPRSSHPHDSSCRGCRWGRELGELELYARRRCMPPQRASRSALSSNGTRPLAVVTVPRAAVGTGPNAISPVVAAMMLRHRHWHQCCHGWRHRLALVWTLGFSCQSELQRAPLAVPRLASHALPAAGTPHVQLPSMVT